MTTTENYMDVLREHDEKEKAAVARFKASPPSLTEAVSRLKNFREYLEWSISHHLPATVAVVPVNSPMPERNACRYLALVSRLIAHLQCNEIEVSNDDVAWILFRRLPFETKTV